MSFCTNCGAQIAEGAKFCTNCGAASTRPESGRKTVYDGNVHKCPNCGEALTAFASVCPTCGYEIRGKSAVASVQTFYSDLSKAQTTEQKDRMIRNFPIPNTKEDIIEFMILASSNILGEDERDIYEAWLAKFEQAYQKALILFAGDPDIVRIQQIYSNCQINIDTEKRRKIGRFTTDTIIRNIAACVGAILMIASVFIDRTGGDSSFLELISYIVLIASAASLFKRGASVIDYAVGAASGLLMTLLSFLLFNGSMGQLCGGIVLIIVAVNYFKSLNHSKMSLFGKPKAGGFMDEIRCDEPSYLIWKWHPAGSVAENNNRENAIRWGSSLRVKDGEVAVFVYRQSDGTMQDFIVGPFDKKIETSNFPVLASIVGFAYAGGTPFQAEVYFINLANIVQVKFGVPFFDVYDPRFLDFGVPVAVRGTVSFRISDYREFIKLHRLNNFNLADFQRQIRDAVSRYVKDTVTNAPAAHNIPVIQLESKTAQINDVVEYDIGERLKETFGVTVSGVDIGAIEIDKQSDGYRQLMAVTKNITTAKMQAEATDYVERLRIQREEGQYAQHKQTQSANIGAFQVEKQAEVGIAGAEALGHMGENGAGGVDLGSGGAGFNPAAMMAGIAVGGAVGQNIAGTMNGMMSGINQQPTIDAVPPPIPTISYHIAVSGHAAGPYDMNTLSAMVQSGQLTAATLVWKSGMAAWSRADAVDELKGLFKTAMPPIPPTEN